MQRPRQGAALWRGGSRLEGIWSMFSACRYLARNGLFAGELAGPPLLAFAAAALLLTTADGCRIPGLGSPVSDALASSREYSREGMEALDRGQQKDAESLLAKAVEACPSNGEARRDYAASLWQRGAKAEAIAQLKEACRLMPTDAAMQGQLAEMHLAVGQREAARSTAETAIRLNPRLPAAWAVRARVMWAAGDLAQALADFQRALGCVPYDQRILLDTAELYRQMNQPQRALETLQSLANTYSPAEEPQQVLYLQGLAYGALGRCDDAVESLAAAAVRDAPSPEILYRLAQAQWLAGRAAEAATTAQQALALDPRHLPTRQLLISMQMAQQPGSPTRR